MTSSCDWCSPAGLGLSLRTHCCRILRCALPCALPCPALPCPAAPAAPAALPCCPCCPAALPCCPCALPCCPALPCPVWGLGFRYRCIDIDWYYCIYRYCRPQVRSEPMPDASEDPALLAALLLIGGICLAQQPAYGRREPAVLPWLRFRVQGFGFRV